MIKTIITPGFEMDYLTFGHGSKSFVILPGLSLKNIFDSAKSIENDYRRFGEEYTVYLFSTRKKLPEKFTLDIMADDIAAAMKALGISGAYIFGASRGGMVAQLIAAYHPELVKKMVIGSSCSRNNAASLATLKLWKELADSRKADELVSEMVDGIYSEAMVKKYGTILKEMFGSISDEELERFSKEAEACIDYNAFNLADKIICPALVIGSYGDKVLAPEAALETAARLGGEIFMYSSEWGHGVYDEAPDYKDRIAAFFRKDSENELCILRDISYGPDERNLLDIVYPSGLNGNADLLFMIHGGAWTSAGKEVYRGKTCADARKGIVTAALSYRYISESVSAFDILDEITAALKTVKAETEKRGIKIRKVIFTGVSAGAHLSLLYAYSRADESPFTPAAVISFCGPADLYSDNALTPFLYGNNEADVDGMYRMISALCGKKVTPENRGDKDIIEALKKVSPVFYVNKSTVPTVICHGMKDITVPFANAVNLDRVLTENGVEHKLIVYPESDHGLGRGRDQQSVIEADITAADYINRFLDVRL